MRLIAEYISDNGSAWLNKYTDGNFSRLPENEKVEWRIKYTEYLAGITDEHIISDGHYAFEDTIVFTDADGDIYDVFFYLYCEPEELLARMQVSRKSKVYKLNRGYYLGMAKSRNRRIEITVP